jgi:light-regulated signal transduction histidine kinase (bacteriophytochrome)
MGCNLSSVSVKNSSQEPPLLPAIRLIAMAAACKIMEPLQQVVPQPGTGLCLAIVQKIIRARGGRIEVASEAGKGTTFSVFIRKALDIGCK